MTDPTNDMRPEPRRKCVACGSEHGSVGAGILCLENEIVVLRGKLRAAMAGAKR
jgi:hypothetical protein